jgi:hypothetical protein
VYRKAIISVDNIIIYPPIIIFLLTKDWGRYIIMTDTPLGGWDERK